jgi:hypothetical protein
LKRRCIVGSGFDAECRFRSMGDNSEVSLPALSQRLKSNMAMKATVMTFISSFANCQIVSLANQIPRNTGEFMHTLIPTAKNVSVKP